MSVHAGVCFSNVLYQFEHLLQTSSGLRAFLTNRATANPTAKRNGAVFGPKPFERSIKLLEKKYKRVKI
jgi:CRISPR/Cas system endoribonuclease Cas6 (RAMP superfamily)